MLLAPLLLFLAPPRTTESDSSERHHLAVKSGGDIALVLSVRAFNRAFRSPVLLYLNALLRLPALRLSALCLPAHIYSASSAVPASADKEALLLHLFAGFILPKLL